MKKSVYEIKTKTIFRFLIKRLTNIGDIKGHFKKLNLFLDFKVSFNYNYLSISLILKLIIVKNSSSDEIGRHTGFRNQRWKAWEFNSPEEQFLLKSYLIKKKIVFVLSYKFFFWIAKPFLFLMSSVWNLCRDWRDSNP